MADAHPATCICHECLPGGAREHRVRPWPAKPADCDHHDYATAAGVNARASSRLRIPTLGGGVIEQCRLCGTVLRQEGPPVLEEPDEA